MSPNDEVRYRILQILYDYYHENPTGVGFSRKPMFDLLNVQENLMDANMLYLEEKRLVRIHGSMAYAWNWAKIKAFGIDVIENKEKYKNRFPFINVQQIHGDVYGNVVQAGGDSHVTIVQIDEAFQRARDLTEAKADISEELKKNVEDNLTTLKEEIKKDELELGKIQKIWKWLKETASWVVPILKDIILKVMEKGI